MEYDFVKRILFRADAAPHLGIGDLMSLIHLSKYLDEAWEIFFMVKDYKASLNLLLKYGINDFIVINKSIEIEDEVMFINKIIEEKNIDIIFFEITERKLTDYIRLSKQVKKACVSFDGYILDDMGLIVNWDVEAFKYFTPSKYPDTKFLLGHEYVILPREFYAENILSREYSKCVRKVLIAMGGADEYDFTSKILKILIESNLDLEIVAIVGSGYDNNHSLEKLVKGSNVSCKIKSNVTNMIDEYIWSDVAIGAGGLTSSELVASKTPSILVATYEHQVARCKFFEKHGWVKYLGFRDFDSNELVDSVKTPIYPNSEALFDTKKIVHIVEELI